MKAKKKHLKRLIQRRKLVSIHRKAIDKASLHGFIVGYSDTLVCLLAINDFRVDGLSIIRRKDISKLRTSDTNQLQRQMLEDDGILQTLDFSHCPPISSWSELFESLSDDEIVIIEDEASGDPLFFIGKILSAERKLVAGHSFTGIGRWDDDPWEIGYKKITCCQLNTSYVNAYQRHFARLESAEST